MSEAKKINKWLIVFITVLVVGLAWGAQSYLRHITTVTTDDAYVAGRVHSIAAKVPGTVLRSLIQDNQLVKKGELLLEIDSIDYELKVKEAQAALEAAQAQVEDAQATVKAAQVNVAMSDIQFKQAGLDKDRAVNLFNSGVVSKEKYEKALTAYDVAQQAKEAAQQQLDKAKAACALAGAAVKKCMVSLDIAKRNLEYTKIYAPADGYVTNKGFEEGNQIAAGQPLLAVVALNDIWIVANYKETQLRKVRVGQRVRIKVDTYKGKEFEGKVDSIMAGTGAAFSLFPPENALGNYVKVVQRIPVKIVLDQPLDTRRVLRIGMSCEPAILVADE